MPANNTCNTVRGLSPPSPGFSPRPIHVVLWWTERHRNRFFSRRVSFVQCSILIHSSVTDDIKLSNRQCRLVTHHCMWRHVCLLQSAHTDFSDLIRVSIELENCSLLVLPKRLKSNFMCYILCMKASFMKENQQMHLWLYSLFTDHTYMFRSPSATILRVYSIE